MSNGYLVNENWDKGEGKSQLPVKRLPIEEVDRLADELVAEYSNSEFRKWYCALINQHGIERVMYWRGKAASGNNPARLFSFYAKQAGDAKQRMAVATPTITQSAASIDLNASLSDEELEAMMDATLEADKSNPWVAPDG